MAAVDELMNEIRSKRKEMELGFLKYIKEFEEMTGTTVDSIDLTHQETLGQPKRTVYLKVNLNLD